MWVKSSYSNSASNCVEARWAKSSLSSRNGSCAEVRAAGGMVQVRDPEDPGGPVLSFAPAQWAAFTAGVKAGDGGTVRE